MALIVPSQISSWADECSDNEEDQFYTMNNFVSPSDSRSMKDEDGFITVSSRSRRRRQRQMHKVNAAFSTKSYHPNDYLSIDEVDYDTREAAYAIQKRYGDISKAARTILQGAGAQLSSHGWLLRDYNTIVTEEMMEEERAERRNRNKKYVRYIRVEDENGFSPHYPPYYIVYVAGSK